MAKILYPVGTQVRVKSVLDHSPLYVVDYRKGEKYPYRLGNTPEGTPVEVAGKSKFSKAGLKRYNPTQTSGDHAIEQQSGLQPECVCYSAEEVDLLLAQQWQDMLEMLSSVDRVASEALRNTHSIADMTDSNFRRVSKKFKTLNHDDD